MQHRVQLFIVVASPHAIEDRLERAEPSPIWVAAKIFVQGIDVLGMEMATEDPGIDVRSLGEPGEGVARGELSPRGV